MCAQWQGHMLKEQFMAECYAERNQVEKRVIAFVWWSQKIHYCYFTCMESMLLKALLSCFFNQSADKSYHSSGHESHQGVQFLLSVGLVLAEFSYLDCWAVFLSFLSSIMPDLMETRIVSNTHSTLEWCHICVFPSGCQAVRLLKGSSLRVSTRQPQML